MKFVFFLFNRTEGKASSKLNEMSSKPEHRETSTLRARSMHSDSEIVRHARTNEQSRISRFPYEEFKRMPSVKPPYTLYASRSTHSLSAQEVSSDVTHIPRPFLQMKNRNATTRVQQHRNEHPDRNDEAGDTESLNSTKEALQKKLNETLLSVTTI